MRVPLFPLNTVLLPGIDQHLFIFEQRYRTMMLELIGPHGDVMNPGASFGVACIRNGFEVGAPAETHLIGTMADVRRSECNPDGTFEVAVIGTRRFRIVERLPDDPYPQAEIELLDEPDGPRVTEALELARAAIMRFVGSMMRTAGDEPPTRIPIPDDPAVASYKMIALLELHIPVRQELLEVSTTSARLVRLAALAHREAGLITIGWPLDRPELRANSLN